MALGLPLAWSFGVIARAGQGDTVLRINGTDEPRRFLLEGRLAGEWVDELSRVVGGVQGGGCLTLDLSDLTFIDQRGVELLRGLSACGAALVGGSAFITTMLLEDAHDPSK